MSQENVEIIERLIEAFDRHDVSTLEALSHRDFEFVSLLTALDAGDATYRGTTAWADYFEAIDANWSEWRSDAIRIFDAGGDRLACLFRMVGTGKLSGVPIERAVGITYQLRDGKVWRMRSYLEPTDALEAVGLSE